MKNEIVRLIFILLMEILKKIQIMKLKEMKKRFYILFLVFAGLILFVLSLIFKF